MRATSHESAGTTEASFALARFRRVEFPDSGGLKWRSNGSEGLSGGGSVGGAGLQSIAAPACRRGRRSTGYFVIPRRNGGR